MALKLLSRITLSCTGNRTSRILVVVFWLPRKLLNPIHFMQSVTARPGRVYGLAVAYGNIQQDKEITVALRRTAALLRLEA